MAPAVTHVKPTQPAPVREAREEVAAPAAPIAAVKKPGLFARIASFFAGGEHFGPAPPDSGPFWIVCMTVSPNVASATDAS